MGYFGIPFRNGVPIGLGSVVSFGAQQFDPSELFVGGTAGAWYDPSDLTTLFTTSAGTTQCAMPGQGSAVSVGLMLDKSQGLVLGPELVTPVANRDFSSNTGYWTPQDGSITISGGAANFSSTTNTFALYAAVGAISASLGKYYEITYTLVSCSAGAIRFGIGANYTTSRSTPGTYTERITAGAGGFFGFYAVGTTTASVDNLSVRELPGNHAIAFNNTTARPELRARVNLLTYSEQFDAAVWEEFRLTKAANVTTAPDGTLTADSYTETAVSATHVSRQLVTLQSGVSYTVSFYAKASTTNYINTSFSSSSNNYVSVEFDVLNGTVNRTSVLGTWTLTSATVTSAGNNWYRCVVTFIPGAAATAVWINMSDGVSAFNSDGQISYLGNTGNTVFLWGADLRPANIGANVPAYQRIADANTYDTSGFPLYLRFDGIDDSMYTPANLNLSSTDKVSVFAGVRKLSDAARGMIVELSGSYGNTGAFALEGPHPAILSDYGFLANGTPSSGGGGFLASPYPSPRTNVLAMLVNLAGATNATQVIPRINGATPTGTAASTASGGNFGSYPLFIGARNNSSLWFNGHLHSLIIAGSAVSAGNISATEQWVAGKTGIVL